jgi:hypothetical protein
VDNALVRLAAVVNPTQDHAVKVLLGAVGRRGMVKSRVPKPVDTERVPDFSYQDKHDLFRTKSLGLFREK